MNRRDILLGALAAAALASTPLALAAVTPKERRAALTEAWERAVNRKVPLLVIVVPEGDARRELDERQQRIGYWLQGGEDQDLAPLAQVELVCARLSELDRLVPGVSEAAWSWMVLVRVDQPTPTWRSIVVPISRTPRWDPAGELPRFRSAFLKVMESEGLQPPRKRQAALAVQARQRWSGLAAPPGGRWIDVGSCLACGMGHVGGREKTLLDLTNRPDPPE